jgi:large subunit ribosomal protein L23
MDPYDVLRRPVVTEKSGHQSSKLGRYSFEVDMRANRHQIKGAVEKAFNVKVTEVNIMHVRGKGRRMGRVQGQTRDWKKAIVTLEAGQTIQFFEGV